VREAKNDEMIWSLFKPFWLLLVPLSVGSVKAVSSAEASSEAQAIDAVLQSTPSATPYRIYALRVGTTTAARRNLFIKDPDLPKTIEIAFSFWVIKGAGRIILVDTGQ